MAKKPRIGVYICHCGGNISDTVDVEKVRENIKLCKEVVVAENYEYVCSNPGQDMIRNGIKEHKLNRIVVAACSPRMHLDTFRRTIKSAGLNPYLLDIVNIREQCSWVHDEKELATAKATDLIRGAVGRAIYLEPLEPESIPVKKDIIVIGGGIAGIITSIELADKGYKVYLVERSPSIGGHMAQLSKTFPTLDCSACILTPKMVYTAQHPNIKIFSMAEVAAVEGSPGNYRVLITKRPRFVDITKCTSCGECAKRCPAKKPSEFEEGLMQEKAIYIPFKQAIPNAYVIDKEKCLFFTKGVCRVCEKFCKAGAIDLNQKEETIELDVGAIIVSTGYQQIALRVPEQYSFGMHPDVVTNLQFERLLKKGMHKPSNGEVAKKVAFILCVGSRMNEEKGKEYCCKIGCMAAIKHTLLLKETVPDAESWVFYTDIRADGKGYEEFYAKARNCCNVRFIRGRAAEVVPFGDRLIVKADDTLLGMSIEQEFDLVVLSLALIPSLGIQELVQKLGIDTGPDGFLLEKHYKLRPVDTRREGIYASGCVLSPKDIRETTLESMATASKVATFIGKGKFLASPEVAYVIPGKCDACGECIKSCPAGAIETTSSGVVVNSISCLGCGICLTICPKEAIDLKHCTEEQLLAQIRGICEGGKPPIILAFLDSTIAYTAADLIGSNRIRYPSYVRIIQVPTTARIGVKHLLYAFAVGADGVFLGDCEKEAGSLSEATEITEKRLDTFYEVLGQYGIEDIRIWFSPLFIPQFSKLANMLKSFATDVEDLGPVKSEVRKKIEKALVEKKFWRK
ncbi:MAG: FAD-dependent oxidoreductase [Candidatus Bathyarchaeia archaeon]